MVPKRTIARITVSTKGVPDARKRNYERGKSSVPSGAEYPLTGFGSGHVTNAGIKPDGYVPRGHRPSGTVA
jgi:hypothetical protein